jgi:hypothetical protein
MSQNHSNNDSILGKLPFETTNHIYRYHRAKEAFRRALAACPVMAEDQTEFDSFFIRDADNPPARSNEQPILLVAPLSGSPIVHSRKSFSARSITARKRQSGMRSWIQKTLVIPGRRATGT